jgi:NAD(P)-dependent dehydrogenase (short-subunit alcohol dehydrogenase family)
MTPKEAFGGGVAVITGAGSGIGAGLAREAGRLGMTVVVADLLRARAENVVGEIKNAGGKAHVHVVDVRDSDAVEAMADRVYKEFGDVRLLVNNAGVETVGFTWELTPAQWRDSMNVLVNGIFYGVRAFVPRMKESVKRGKRAAIANTSSLGSMSIAAMMTPYIAGKHAALSLTECLSLEMELTNTPIDVSVIVPGLVSTRIFKDSVVAAGRNASWADRHRHEMAEWMEKEGKQPDDVAPFLFRQLADRNFWISTHPDKTLTFTDDRINHLSSRKRPPLSETQRAMYQHLREE